MKATFARNCRLTKRVHVSIVAFGLVNGNRTVNNYIGQGVRMMGAVPVDYDRYGYDLSRSLGQDWRVSA